MQYGLRVAVRAIDVAARFQGFAEIRVIVNLAVVDDVERAVLVGHRLMARRDINDAQTAVAQAHTPVNEDALVVRPAMRNHVAHAFEHAHVKLAARAAGQCYSVNPAHKLRGSSSTLQPIKADDRRRMAKLSPPSASKCSTSPSRRATT